MLSHIVKANTTAQPTVGPSNSQGRSLQTRATGLIPASFVNQISRAEHEAAQQQTEAAPEAADPWVDSAPAPASTQPPAAASAASVSGKYQVLYDFRASAEDELTIAAGDLVLVRRPGEDEGWLHGALGGREGIFPSSYVEPWTEAAASAADDSWANPFPAPASGPAADLAIPFLLTGEDDISSRLLVAAACFFLLFTPAFSSAVSPRSASSGRGLPSGYAGSLTVCLSSPPSSSMAVTPDDGWTSDGGWPAGAGGGGGG